MGVFFSRKLSADKLVLYVTAVGALLVFAEMVHGLCQHGLLASGDKVVVNASVLTLLVLLMPVVGNLARHAPRTFAGAIASATRFMAMFVVIVMVGILMLD